MLVGVTAEHNRPVATRGWGCRFFEDDSKARVLIPRNDIKYLQPDGSVAVTIAHVRTFHSAQIKGRIIEVEPTAESSEDLEMMSAHREGYFGTVAAVDGFPRPFLDRMCPAEFSAFTMTVEELYNQTPGPRAGVAVTT